MIFSINQETGSFGSEGERRRRKLAHHRRGGPATGLLESKVAGSGQF